MSDAVPVPQGLITHDNVWQFGVLGVVCVGLVLVIIVLWRHNVKRDTQQGVERESMATERNAWETERERTKMEQDKYRAELRSEYEAKHASIAANYAKELIEQVRLFRENDTATRRDFTDTLKDMSAAQEKANDKNVAMVEKLTDRIVIVAKQPQGRY